MSTWVHVPAHADAGTGASWMTLYTTSPLLVVTRHPRICDSEHEQHPHHHVVLSWTLNWISVPSLNRLPNSDELVADAATEPTRSARTNATTAHLFITPLTSVQAAHYTLQPVGSFHAAAGGEEVYPDMYGGGSRSPDRDDVERRRGGKRSHALAKRGRGEGTGTHAASDRRCVQQVGKKSRTSGWRDGVRVRIRQ
jgi:hypothetical protein